MRGFSQWAFALGSVLVMLCNLANSRALGFLAGLIFLLGVIAGEVAYRESK